VRERGLAGESVRVVELQTERRGERRRVGGRDVVRGHAPAGAEVAEVERRAVGRAAAAAGPLDLGDLLPAALGRLGERLGAEHAGIERRRAVGERLPVHVKRVVRRPGDAGPRTRGQREPAGAGVRRCLGQQAVVRCPRTPAQQLAEPGHDALVGVLLDRVLAQAVGGEEQQLVVPTVAALDGGRPGRLGADPWHETGGDERGGEYAHHATTAPAAVGSR